MTSKLVAGRAKDYEFAAALVKAGLIKLDVLAKRIDRLDIEPTTREGIAALVGWTAPVAPSR